MKMKTKTKTSASKELMEDLEGLAGLKRTKGGSKDTEPAYVVSRKILCRFLGVLVATVCVTGVSVWRSDKLLKRLSPKLAQQRAELRLAQHSAHSRVTKLGQELEQHLEMDIRERDMALTLRAKMRELEKVHKINVSRALDAAALSEESVTFQARNAMQPYVELAFDGLFKELRGTLEAHVVGPMLSTSVSASERHRSLHEEILEELRKDAEEREWFSRATSEPAVDYTFYVDEAWGAGWWFWGDWWSPTFDQHWVDEHFEELETEKNDEKWRGDVIAHFVESFETHFNDSAMVATGLEPRTLLAEDSTLFDELLEMQKVLEFDWGANDNVELSWRDAEKKLRGLAPKLRQFRCPDFKPATPDADDHDYMQFLNVAHYVNELVWQARLNARKDVVATSIRKYKDGDLTSMTLIESLEALNGEHIFPGSWLYPPPGEEFDFDNTVFGAWDVDNV